MEPLEQVRSTWFDTLHPAFIELRTSGTRDYACESMQMIRKQLRSCAEFLLVNGEVTVISKLKFLFSNRFSHPYSFSWRWKCI